MRHWRAPGDNFVINGVAGVLPRSLHFGRNEFEFHE
jgi:hypothetical protein